eukprot:TRINITY_DN998_c0_g1_i9.p1 TRINITY_DN998_c0_g1~~TRINITY_DN998_c0_g1_i9.p1  ORF type:complete len:177 (-),score=25.86 TRINITY_DN998_c0_g1_i9:232-762(-)
MNSQNPTPLHIAAHATAITQLVLNSRGSRLATASEKGTLVRIYDTSTGNKTTEFRRGTQGAIIHSLSFNKSGTYLCLSSSTATIHIYACDEIQGNTTSGFSLFKGWVPLAGDVWSSRQIYLPQTEQHTICAFAPEEGDKHVIIVLSASGKYYKYTFTETSNELPVKESEEYFIKQK